MAMNLTDGIEDVKVDNMADKYIGCIHHYTLTTADLRKLKMQIFLLKMEWEWKIFLERLSIHIQILK